MDTGISLRAEGSQKKMVLQKLWRGVQAIPAYTILLAWSIFTVFGMLWTFMSSFKRTGELFKNVWAIPISPYLENYNKAWSVVKMGSYFGNSVIVVSISIILILIVSAPAAYVLTRIRFFGVGFLNQFFVAGMGIPYPLLFIPLFGMLRTVGLIDSLQGLIVIYVALSIPFTVFLLTGFFATLPVEIEESAALDGAGSFRIFFNIMLPLASPGLLTAAIFNFIGLWNEYMLALMFMTTQKKSTVALGLYALQSSMQYTGDWGALFAGVMIVVLPTIFLYILLSERMMAGITLGMGK
jgi:ABC-type glycerol-3-phosphate transport system permease component